MPPVHPTPAFDPRLRIVEPPPRGKSQPLRQPAHRGLIRERDRGFPQPVSPVYPDRIRPCHQDIGDLWIVQQRFEYPGPGHLRLQQPQCAQQIRVTENSSRLGPNRGGHLSRVRICCPTREALSNTVQ
jgi:hypothetical protein